MIAPSFSEYLVRHGRLADFGRFRAEPALVCQRGQRVVVRTFRGLELGEILAEAGAEHAPFLPNTTVGALVRLASPEDEAREIALAARGLDLLGRAVQLAEERCLPLAFLDAEILLDGQRGVLHHLTDGTCDPRELVSRLAGEFDLTIELLNLSDPPAEAEEEDHDHAAGCGSCGSEGGSCGSGGCGSCGSKKQTREHFSRLREEMDRRRTPLL